MRWLLLIFVFIFGIIVIEIYQNVELVKNSYAMQRLQAEIKKMEKENNLLKKKLSSSLSLGRLERYARNELNLSDPYRVRLIKERPLREKEPPPSFGIRERLSHQFGRLFFSLYDKVLTWIRQRKMSNW